MINYLIRLVICGAVVLIIPNYLKGVVVDTFMVGVLVAFVMSLLNTFVKPILNLIAIPITFMTLGLFSLLITIFIVYVCDYLVDGFKVNGLVAPLILSFVLSIVNGLVGLFQDK
jgi:putative membrane protein